MAVDAWLPVGYKLPDGTRARLTLFEGQGWQIVETERRGRALIAETELANRWTTSGLLEAGVLQSFSFGHRQLYSLSSGPSQMLCPVFDSRSPNSKDEALAFALALKATRSIDEESPLHDAIYVERFSRLLPTFSISSRVTDDVVLGYWLTGGANVSVRASRRLAQMLSWMGEAQLAEVLTAAGLKTSGSTEAAGEVLTQDRSRTQTEEHHTCSPRRDQARDGSFRLPGRPDLERFFNDHVVDIVQNGARYKAFGIDFPSAIVLHGPPGCGKTFAVERLVDFLGWPSFQIEASSVASPYIHETSRKVAAVFENAIKSAPSVLIIDEMDAFLANREMGSGHHRVEEVAEFLRRIPEAGRNQVLVVAMTNRLDMIDPAILRRGRFDHIVAVDYATAPEVQALLEKLVSSIPTSGDVDPTVLANELAGRPLSDVAFVIREGARLAARSGRHELDQASLDTAIKSLVGQRPKDGSRRRIGFF